MQNEDIGRRAQLAEFLRFKRAQGNPEQSGFVRGPRRRTPGLRREEVAELAGVSHVWYTWLEQGRPVMPSAKVMDRLGQALRLNGDERAYLQRLLKLEVAPRDFDGTMQVPDRIIDLIKSFEYQPAYVRNLRWDLLAWNNAHVKVFGDYSSIPIEHRNILWLLFTDPGMRALTDNWDVIAQHIVAKFRADLSKNGSNIRADQLIDQLMAVSPDFARWWKQYRTTEALTHLIEINHPHAGQITLERVTLHTESDLAQSVIVYMPVDAGSSKRLKVLCR